MPERLKFSLRPVAIHSKIYIHVASDTYWLMCSVPTLPLQIPPCNLRYLLGGIVCVVVYWYLSGGEGVAIVFGATGGQQDDGTDELRQQILVERRPAEGSHKVDPPHEP